MKGQAKTIVSYIVVFPAENTFTKKKIITGLLALVFVILATGCSKSSSSTFVNPPPPGCSSNICKLTSHKWTIKSETISTDAGDYTSSTAQLASIPWATFLFRADTTYTNYTGYTNKYSYTDATKTLILKQDNLSLYFKVDSIAQFFLVLEGLRFQMHPRTDYSPEANFAINGVAGSLYNEFGVDTSAIQYIQPVYTYVY